MIHKHDKTCCRTTFQILKELDLLTPRGNVKIYTNTAKHAAEQHFINSKANHAAHIKTLLADNQINRNVQIESKTVKAKN